MRDSVNLFDDRIRAYEDLDGRSLAAIVHAGADLALLLDAGGIVLEVSFGAGVPPIEESRQWVGQPWVNTVTPESQARVREILEETAATGASVRRQVNHPSTAGPDIPIAYAAARLGRSGDVVALGRDLRPVSTLQQQLIDTQQALERDYWRMRHIETRYRLLVQLSSEAILLVDVNSLKIVEANPAAGRLFDVPPKRLIGRAFPIDFDRASAYALQEIFSTVRTSGRTEEARVQLEASEQAFMLGVSLVRQDASSLYLVRMLPDAGETLGTPEAGAGPRVLQMLHGAPDGFVVTDSDGQVVSANRSFLDLAQLASEEQIRGQPLARWLGRPGADVGVVLETLREHGVVRLFATSVRGEYGSSTEVELSAMMAPSAMQPYIGMLIRDVGRRMVHGPQGARDLTLAVEQLTALVGRVSLRDLTRDTTDLVERHFIEAALELTGQNRTSAAEVLGVSRQSLYVKMRRYQIGGRENPPKP
jgi:transcriptional regulator PpsR